MAGGSRASTLVAIHRGGEKRSRLRMSESHGQALHADIVESSSLYNKDLAPVRSERRLWRTYNYAALWISMSVNIPTYMLASGMIAGGMSWKQALFTVFLGNVLVLIPMLLNAHAGAQYGIPFPVFARASFGTLGANIPAILRALVACGWFGIQTWIGGEAINAMIVALAPGWAKVHSGPAGCFVLFWLLNVFVILRGIETIRFLQGISAPFLLLIGLVLLLWARLGHPWAVVLAMIGLLMATLNVNVAANVVSPANDFSNLSPRRISFRTGGMITAVVGLLMQPWKLLSSYGSYIFTWLVGYSGFLGPIAGVLICDYFVLRKKILSLDDLYRRSGQYEYSRGFHWAAIVALAAGAGVAFVGLIVPPLRALYNYAWFVGFLVSFVVYFAFMPKPAPAVEAAD